VWLTVAVIGAIASIGYSPGAKRTGAFASYVPQVPPQRAVGDFDGDGRVDIAVVQQRAGAGRISLQLSSSSSAVDLAGAIISVVPGANVSRSVHSSTV
jgi:hypothetical protein